MSEIRIPYKPNKVIFLFLTAFFGVSSVVLVNKAMNNERGLVLNKIVEMSSASASVFYWILAAVSIALSLLGIYSLLKSVAGKLEVVITENSITAPKSGISKKTVEVSYSDIRSMNVQTIQKTKILNIEHVDGKLSIPNSMLPNKESFDHLITQLQSRTNG